MLLALASIVLALASTHQALAIDSTLLYIASTRTLHIVKLACVLAIN